jgi:hypothetical protein
VGHACRQRSAAASSVVLENQLLGLLVKLARRLNRTQAIVVVGAPEMARLAWETQRG